MTTLDSKTVKLIQEWKDGYYKSDAQKYANLQCRISALVKSENQSGWSDGVDAMTKWAL